MKKTTEQFTVLCEGLFLNDTKPEKWEQDFPWEPSVGIHFRVLDDTGEPAGEVQKKYKKQIWLWQTMGGKNAKGRYFRMEAESGEMPAKDGKPAKPYTSIMPMAEVFADGTARFLEAPKDGKVNTPGPAEKPKGPVIPAGAKKVEPEVGKPSNSDKGTSGTKPVIPNNKPRPKPNEKFIASCFEPSTNQFFRMQDGFTEDGWVLNQAQELARSMVILLEGQGFTSRSNEVDFGRAVEKSSEDHLKKQFSKWVNYFEVAVSEKRWAKIRNRIYCLIQNCLIKDQVVACVEMAWAKLPPSYYEQVREKARLRLEGVTVEGVLKVLDPNGQPLTATPEIYDPKFEDFVDEEDIRQSLEPKEEPSQPEEPAPVPAGPPPEEIDWCLKAFDKYTDFKKLLAFWNDTKPALQAVEEVRQGFRLWVANKFMASKYQQDVDGIREIFPPGLMTKELETTLHARYAELASF